MKARKFNPLHVLFLSTAVALSPAVLFAQADPMVPPSPTQPNQPQQPSSPSMSDSVGAPGMTGQMMKDKIFLRKAVEGGLAKVQFGQLAALKAASPDVKSFGQKMVTDHIDLNQQMATVADSLGIMLPKKISKEDQVEFEKLNSLSGNDFDTEYLTVMVRDHHKDLHEFREEAANASDPVLKDAVSKATFVIREHAVMADKLARDKGIPVPSHKKSAPAPPAGSSGNS